MTTSQNQFIDQNLLQISWFLIFKNHTQMVNETSLLICLEWNGFRLLPVSTLIPGEKPSRLLGELDLLPPLALAYLDGPGWPPWGDSGELAS